MHSVFCFHKQSFNQHKKSHFFILGKLGSRLGETREHWSTTLPTLVARRNVHDGRGKGNICCRHTKNEKWKTSNSFKSVQHTFRQGSGGKYVYWAYNVIVRRSSDTWEVLSVLNHRRVKILSIVLKRWNPSPQDVAIGGPLNATQSRDPDRVSSSR